MAYNVNPFLERRSERTTSDQEFALVFSPKILEKLSNNVLTGGVHIFRSAPGGGKTTILRAFTPSVLRSFWRSKANSELKESFPLFVEKGVIDDQDGPKLLGVLISCASGYADLPVGNAGFDEGLFRALLDCRVVLRTLRSLTAYLGLVSDESLENVQLEYDENAKDLQQIPKQSSARSLVDWAEKQEKKIYAELDAFAGGSKQELPTSQRFESVIWLQSVKFIHKNSPVVTNKLLMIDDLHRLRKKQRQMLIDEFTVQRPEIPVWLAMRTLVLGDTLLSQGARLGRDIDEVSLEELWGGVKGQSQFSLFAQNILDRRMNRQDTVPGNFSQHLRSQLEAEELQVFVQPGIEAFRKEVQPFEGNARYSEWLARADKKSAEPTLDMLLELFVTRILVVRDAGKKQMSLELTLAAEEIDDKDSSSLRGAAEIHLHELLKLPYYYGLERLCVMATSNVEELLSMAAALYDGIVARQILSRKSGPELSPLDQEKILREAASKRLSGIPKQHTEGTRAQKLIVSIGSYCRDKTFLPNAPYAPGVTGIRLSDSEMEKLNVSSKGLGESGVQLRQILSECIAENLLVLRPSSASTARESGSIFYLNRTLCAHFGLPLQLGGWQDVTCLDLIDWMIKGWKPKQRLEIGGL